MAHCRNLAIMVHWFAFHNSCASNKLGDLLHLSIRFIVIVVADNPGATLEKVSIGLRETSYGFPRHRMTRNKTSTTRRVRTEKAGSDDFLCTSDVRDDRTRINELEDFETCSDNRFGRSRYHNKVSVHDARFKVCRY